jgi:diacylglycerol O-acyltransferase
VRPVNRTGSPLMMRRSLVRHLGVHEVPLTQLREAAHRGGGAHNDASIAALAGGLRRYHEKHGAAVDELHLTMPISLRTEADEMGGNRITLMRFDVPVGLADPVERIGEIHRRASNVRHERSLPHTQAIAGVLNLMPRWYIGSILRHVDFVASDVPGIPVPVFLGGASVRAQYAFGPTIGAAVNITLLTYVDVCAFGINVDTGAIADYDVFYDCLVDGFDEYWPWPTHERRGAQRPAGARDQPRCSLVRGDPKQCQQCVPSVEHKHDLRGQRDPHPARFHRVGRVARQYRRRRQGPRPQRREPV